MKPQKIIRIAQACLAAIVLMAAGAATVTAAPLAINGQLVIRPLTPQEKKDYLLPNAQGASGLSSIGVGQPAYLEVLINANIALSGVTNVTWTLSAKPATSVLTNLADSPLGTNVPTYSMSDRFNNSYVPYLKVASRMMLLPDVAGQYTVTVTINTVTNGNTNFTQKITAGTYMGASVCALCHSGSSNISNVYPSWSVTPHASFFTRAIGGTENSHYGANCISCHTVGYDTNAAANNGGFDDIAKQVGWTFPTNIAFTNLAATNWSGMDPLLQNVANIQCENCHGPGSEHVSAAIYPEFSRTNLVNWPRIGVSFDAGNCAQCHDSKPNHVRNAEWNNSKHAVTTRSPSGTISRIACVRCHTAPGVADYLANKGTTNKYATNFVYEAISCSACHDPHNNSNPYQLRAGTSITLDDGTLVTTAGSGAFCMNCHQSRTGSVTNSIVRYPVGLPTYNGGSSFGPHDNPAAEMLMGVNGWTYGLDIPSAAHGTAVSNTCAGCHMQTVASTDPGFTKVGGHTFSMVYNVVTNGVTNVVDQVNVCVQCHGPIEEFNFRRRDYDGDGVIDGVQTEVQHLLNKLTTLMPSSTYVSNGNYVADGLVKTSVSVKTNWPPKFLKAGWNFQLVNNDLSKGIHNAPYAIGLLKASISDLTDDWNNDGMPDTWQIANFGSITNPLCAPKATPANDGIPNWLKYNLGLNPMTPGLTVPGGVVYANGTKLFNSADTNTTLKIYTAAEVAFNGEVGKTYQIQGISAINGTWMNVSSNIAGTGGTISYVTPIRTNVQQYFRVISTP